MESDRSLVANKVFTGRFVYLFTLLLQIWTNFSFAPCAYGAGLHRCEGATKTDGDTPSTPPEPKTLPHFLILQIIYVASNLRSEYVVAPFVQGMRMKSVQHEHLPSVFRDLVFRIEKA